MSGNAFLDTNIFIYAYDRRDPVKQSVAANLIRDLGPDNAVISYQVVHEFFNIALTKSRVVLAIPEAQSLLHTVFRPLLKVPSTVSLVNGALQLQQRYLLSWYDSLIVAAAQQAGCRTLYSEDLQHGQKFDAVTVTNPFL